MNCKDTDKNILIIIPARYQSSRLPGKPLVKIKGVEMLRRVAAIAAEVCRNNNDCSYVVATDDRRIEDFCLNCNINVAMTSEHCSNGTERCYDLVERYSRNPQLVVNLQGDNPLCPPWVVQDLIDEWRKTAADVYTPVVSLSWDEYDKLLVAKQTSPFSGTTALCDKNGFALAFSKNILPAIRKPEKAKAAMANSPVLRHIGLYAYSLTTLKNYNDIDKSVYEDSNIEGLEQLRFLYNGLKIKLVTTDYRGRETMGGVDSPEDVSRVEKIIEKYGELVE